MSEVEIPEHCHEILKGATVGTISTIRVKDGLISTNPVGYVWDGKQLRISTLKSRVKCKNLVANPTVAFCVVSVKDLTQYVEIRGHATIEDDDADNSFFRRQFFEGTAGEEPPDDLDPPGSQRVILTIHPEQVSSPAMYGGRFEEKWPTVRPER